MTERDQTGMSAEDLALDRHLLTLQRFAPSPGFGDRVLARVRLPVPAVAWKRTVAKSLVTPRRLWWASGLAAASSTAWIVAAANWVSEGGWQALVSQFTSSVALPAWALALQLAALAGQQITTSVFGAYAAMGNAVYPAAAAAMITPVLSMWGLYLTLKQPHGKRIAAYAAR